MAVDSSAESVLTKDERIQQHEENNYDVVSASASESEVDLPRVKIDNQTPTGEQLTPHQKPSLLSYSGHRSLPRRRPNPWCWVR